MFVLARKTCHKNIIQPNVIIIMKVINVIITHFTLKKYSWNNVLIFNFSKNVLEKRELSKLKFI